MKEMVDQLTSGAARVTKHPPARYGDRRRGAIAVSFAILLPVVIAFFGLALDLARVYNRKAEMQGIADTIAISAAKKLNGTKAGIADALAAASDVLVHGDDPDFRPRYGYVNTMAWSDAAIKFGKSADGSSGWLDAGAASATPLGLSFVKVDTSALDPSYGEVNMVFAQVLSSSLTTMNVRHTAVAGRRRIKVTPLGICAMSTAPNYITQRTNSAGYGELVEYGFRRGVGYNLMRLNPVAASTTGANFLVDPVALSGSGSSPKNLTLATVGPYVCTGTMTLPSLVGATVNVQSGFPLDLLVNHLNSRFDTGGACDPSTAPPDTNVKPYTAATLAWMNTKPPTQTAATDTSIRLQTKADLDPPNNLDNTQATTSSGPLWAYAHAVAWSSYVSGKPEPEGGYSPFTADQLTWNALYGISVSPNGYPTPITTSAPYTSITTQPPTVTHRPGVANRRVLNVPILDCSPMPTTTAKVLAIGRFFMTVPAVYGGTPTTNTISAEFAGATSDVQAGGPVELVQ
jgi:hypothetical protein